MLPLTGPVVASPDVSPPAWIAALDDAALPIALVPGSGRGWFGGLAIVAWAPEMQADGLTLAEAAAALECTFDAGGAELTVALLPYDAPASVARYAGGLVLTAEGWRTWGALEPGEVPALPPSEASAPGVDQALATDVTTDLTARGFRSGVRAVAEGIAAGDFYVLNLTRRLTGRPTLAPTDAFAALIARTEADMAAYWQAPGATIVSASPERFVRLTGDRVEIQPIKGTRPRAPGVADAALARELVASEKERAEHVMIVDLERNDLGRVCLPGSVTADPLFGVVATPYCHQMVSIVSGRLCADATLGGLLEATFPCGSVTGAPKIAAMRAIAALEASPRGAYTGSLVIAIPGALDSSVLIRTAEYADGVVRWGTGGGITADSDPAEEWLETVLKASPFVGDGTPEVALRETARVVAGRVPLLARHLARLAAGGCGPTVLARVRAEVAEAVGLWPDAGYGRLSVTVETDGTVDARITSARSSLDVPGGPVLSVVRADAPELPPGAAKPSDRSAWDEAQLRARAAGGDQAVLVDARGMIIDGATASIWVRIGDELLTPPAPPALDGVARGVVFDAAAALGFTALERELPATLLAGADEVFCTNALAGVVSARGRAGPAAAELQAVFGRTVGIL